MFPETQFYIWPVGKQRQAFFLSGDHKYWNTARVSAEQSASSRRRFVRLACSPTETLTLMCSVRRREPTCQTKGSHRNSCTQWRATPGRERSFSCTRTRPQFCHLPPGQLLTENKQNDIFTKQALVVLQFYESIPDPVMSARRTKSSMPSVGLTSNCMDSLHPRGFKTSYLHFSRSFDVKTPWKKSFKKSVF